MEPGRGIARLLLPLFAGLLWRLPRRTASAVGTALGELARWTDAAGRATARAALGTCLPKLPPEKKALLLRRAYRHQGRIGCQGAAVGRRGAERFCRDLEIVGWEHLEEAAEPGRGVIFLGAPLGCPEIAAVALSLYQGVSAQEAAGAAEALLAARTAQLEGGGRVLIGLAAGAGEAVVEAPFFGGVLPIDPAPARLSLASGAPVVIALAGPGSAGDYRLQLGPPIAPGGSESALGRRYLEHLEREIRARPEQWPWMRADWRPR